MLKMKKLLFIIFLASLPFSTLAAEMQDLDLHIKDHKFHPEILEAQEGAKIRITVYNDDPTIEEFDSIDLKREKIIPGKSKTKVILAPLKPGEYHFIGEFHEETAKGKLIIKPKDE